MNPTVREKSEISQKMSVVSEEVLRMTDARRAKLKELKECIDKIRIQLNNVEVEISRENLPENKPK